MNIQDFLDQLDGAGNLKDVVAKAHALAAPVISKKEVSDFLKRLGTALRENSHQEAVKLTCALFRWSPKDAIGKIRRDGTFRASKYAFKNSALKKVIDTAISLSQGTDLPQEKLQYLTSVQALQSIVPEVRRLHAGLIKRMSGRRKFLLKTLLAVVDGRFSRPNPADIESDPRNISHWGAEEIAEGFSYIVHLAQENPSGAHYDWLLTDINIANPLECTYESLLVDAIHIRKYCDLELELDGLPYKVKQMGNDLHVDSINPTLEQSIRLGFIQHENQASSRVLELNLARKAQGRADATFKKVCDGIFESGFKEHIELKTFPRERLTVPFVLAREFFGPIADDSVYDDEAVELLGIQIDGFTGPLNPMPTKIYGDITVGDIVKVQRFFRFLSNMINRKCDEIEDSQHREEVRVASIISVLKRTDLAHLFELILTAEKAEPLIELLTLKEKKVIDIQYAPLIENGEYIIIPPSIAGLSNLVRNCTVYNRLGKTFAPTDDPMVQAIVASLEDANFLTRAEFNLDKRGSNKLEADIICWRESKLFVFECKNFFHPTGSHELRTGYEHLKTAADQLTERRNWLIDKDNQRELFKRLNWNVTPTDEIYTGIITASRVFNGYSIQGHPIRQGNEFTNVVESGFMRKSNGGNWEEWSFWAGDEFHANDLVEYLEGRSIIKRQLDELEPYFEDLLFGTKRLRFRRYFLDLRRVTTEGMRQVS